MQKSLMLSLATLAALAASCSSDSGGGTDPRHRYEPSERLDHDNTAFFPEDGKMLKVGLGSGEMVGGDMGYQAPYLGGMPESLDLPDSPKSGFRLVLPRVVLEPHQEIFFCTAWPMPEITRHHIYASELHAGPGVHHANMFAVPRIAEEPNPYPNCFQDSAAGFIGDGIMAIFEENYDFRPPEVLFANSTQIVGEDGLYQPEGYGSRIGEVRDVVLDTHLLNPTSEELVVEAVYDFYTMPEEMVTHETVPFVWLWLDFLIPARSKKNLSATCDWFDGGVGANIVSIMPHMHQWGVGYQVDLLERTRQAVLDTPYNKNNSNLVESDIESYDPPISTAGADQIRFTCKFNNPFDHDMGMGVGENEMCFLFGFVTPPEAQGLGVILTEGVPCWSFNTGRPETLDDRSLADLLETIPPDRWAYLLEKFGGFLED